MLRDPLFILVALACIAVAVILAIGIKGFGVGGVEGAKRSNKLMQLRILAQFGAVVLILLFVVANGGR